MEIDRSRIGDHSRPKVTEIERGAVRRFAEALGETEGRSLDLDEARHQGFRDLVAPPTFAVTLVVFEVPGLKLPKAGVLHGEQEFTFDRLLVAGEEISVEAWVDDLKTRSGSRGRMHIVTVLNEGRDMAGERVFLAKSVLVVNEEGDT